MRDVPLGRTRRLAQTLSLCMDQEQLPYTMHNYRIRVRNGTVRVLSCSFTSRTGEDFNDLAVPAPGQCSQVATATRAGPMVGKRRLRNVVRRSLRQFYPRAVRDIPNRAPGCPRSDYSKIRTPPALPGNSPCAGRGNLPCAHHDWPELGMVISLA